MRRRPSTWNANRYRLAAAVAIAACLFARGAIDAQEPSEAPTDAPPAVAPTDNEPPPAPPDIPEAPDDGADTGDAQATSAEGEVRSEKSGLCAQPAHSRELETGPDLLKAR